MIQPISGFSKLSKEEKINWLSKTYFQDPIQAQQLLEQYWNTDVPLQKLHDEFIENTVSNFYFPLGVAPNFLINERLYAIPMATEESSVVAAASKAAKFWQSRGGFKAEVLSTTKIGQIHFTYSGDSVLLTTFFKEIKQLLIDSVREIMTNMEKRGGGLKNISLIDKTASLAHYYQLHCEFETLDAMGANFINSCLEQFAKTFTDCYESDVRFSEKKQKDSLQVIMSILSNYVPDCIVRTEVSCPVASLTEKDIDGQAFAEKFIQAIQIAEVEPYRAVTHNKGIMNGIDAVIIATGNDFRAVEAGVHAYAARDKQYASLTKATIVQGVFRFWMEIPLALGTVGGLTKLHPLAKWSLSLLQQPSARELMQIVATAGLAQNFAAVKSLVTTGIQKGHMKMHLMNILNQFQATSSEKELAITYFKTNKVSYSGVSDYLNTLRN